ncbi:MAG: response regulator transcription factor [Actinobacteria bacterium]|nr:response regulator transcription factor [Actinomycetota bacterium]
MESQKAAGLRVLVVEDSAPVGDLVRRSLESEGFLVDVATDLRSARAALTAARPDVMVLDVELPDGSGLELLRASEGPSVPIVVLSSRREEIDRVIGLELGAEDYVIKPFLPRELATRVRRAATRPRPEPVRSLDFGDIVIDLARRQVHIFGRLVELTPREFDLLAHLAGSAGRVCSREELLRDVWHSSREWQSAKTVTEHIRRLRQKIEPDALQPVLIVTVGRAGYRWTPEAKS